MTRFVDTQDSLISNTKIISSLLEKGLDSLWADILVLCETRGLEKTRDILQMAQDHVVENARIKFDSPELSLRQLKKISPLDRTAYDKFVTYKSLISRGLDAGLTPVGFESKLDYQIALRKEENASTVRDLLLQKMEVPTTSKVPVAIQEVVSAIASEGYELSLSRGVGLDIFETCLMKSLDVLAKQGFIVFSEGDPVEPSNKRDDWMKVF